MSEWKKVLIKDLGRTVTGHTPPTKEKKYFGDFMPFIKPTDISKDEKYTYHPEQYYSREAAEKYKNSLIPKGATCVVCIGTIGEKITMAHCDLFTNQSINSIIPSDEYDPNFVYYLLKYNLAKVKSLNKGTASGREFVSKSTFLDMPVMVCEDKGEQIRIGSILSHYDSLIENYQRQVKLLEEAAQRLYKEWFVDFHFPGYESTKIVDGVPEGWEKTKLSSIAEFRRGKTVVKKEITDGNIPVVAGGLTPAYYFNKSNTEDRVITISGSGANAGFTRMYYQKIWASDCSFADKTMTHYLYFVYCFLKTNKVLIDNLQKGAAQPHVYAKDINSLELLLPNLDTINSFEQKADKVFERIGNVEYQIRLLTEARDRMLPKLMSGEIEV